MIQDTPTTCPKCGVAVQGPSETCNYCGVIFSRIRPGSPTLAPQARPFAPEARYAAPVEMPTLPSTSRCQACGGPGPTTHTEFHQNIGALVMRFTKTVEGDLCSRCVKKYFTECTLVTVLVGWLGVISLFIAPIYVILNIINVFRANSALAKAT